MNFIRSSILKVTFEGKSGCGLTLYSLGTSRSNVTTGKKQHFPHQFSPAGLLFQMAGRHTRYFRACTVCLHFLLGKAQVFLDGVCRVLFGCVCPLCVVHHRRMAARTLSERPVCLAGWWSEPNIYPNKFILIMCQMEWRMQAQTFLSLSFFFFGPNPLIFPGQPPPLTILWVLLHTAQGACLLLGYKNSQVPVWPSFTRFPST